MDHGGRHFINQDSNFAVQYEVYDGCRDRQPLLSEDAQCIVTRVFEALNNSKAVAGT